MMTMWSKLLPLDCALAGGTVAAARSPVATVSVNSRVAWSLSTSCARLCSRPVLDIRLEHLRTFYRVNGVKLELDREVEGIAS